MLEGLGDYSEADEMNWLGAIFGPQEIVMKMPNLNDEWISKRFRFMSMIAPSLNHIGDAKCELHRLRSAREEILKSALLGGSSIKDSVAIADSEYGGLIREAEESVKKHQSDYDLRLSRIDKIMEKWDVDNPEPRLPD